MQKCSHKISVHQHCPKCAELARAKGLDEESQALKLEDEWRKETERRAQDWFESRVDNYR